MANFGFSWTPKNFPAARWLSHASTWGEYVRWDYIYFMLVNHFNFVINLHLHSYKPSEPFCAVRCKPLHPNCFSLHIAHTHCIFAYLFSWEAKYFREASETILNGEKKVPTIMTLIRGGKILPVTRSSRNSVFNVNIRHRGTVGGDLI